MKSPKTFFVLLTLLLLSSLYVNFVQFRARAGRAVAQTANLGQSEALCDIAKENLHQHWADEQKNIEKVIQVVNSPQEVESKLKTDLAQIRETLALKEVPAGQFAAKYQPIFRAHIQKFRERLNQKTPDWPGMFQVLKEFYAAEDQLVKDSFGESALAKFRESQTKKRTTILALAGQYANIPWDQSIRW